MSAPHRASVAAMMGVSPFAGRGAAHMQAIAAAASVVLCSLGWATFTRFPLPSDVRSIRRRWRAVGAVGRINLLEYLLCYSAGAAAREGYLEGIAWIACKQAVFWDAVLKFLRDATARPLRCRFASLTLSPPYLACMGERAASQRFVCDPFLRSRFVPSSHGNGSLHACYG